MVSLYIVQRAVRSLRLNCGATLIAALLSRLIQNYMSSKSLYFNRFNSLKSQIAVLFNFTF